MLDRWLTQIILTKVNDEATRTLLILVLLVALWSAQAVVLLRVWRWTVSGISLDSGTVLHFDGGAAATFGFVSLGNLLAGLLVPTRGLIVLAYPPLFLLSTRWWIGHIHGEQYRLRFVGSLTQMWWRTLAALIFIVPVITIPRVVVWLNKWGAANILVEPVE